MPNISTPMNKTLEPLSQEQKEYRLKKGLRISDRFADAVRNIPNNKFGTVYDQETKTKIPMDFEQIGKPNVMMSFSGIQNQDYIMN